MSHTIRKMTEQDRADVLEAEEDNETAVKLYRQQGFTVLPYMEMKK